MNGCFLRMKSRVDSLLAIDIIYTHLGINVWLHTTDFAEN